VYSVPSLQTPRSLPKAHPLGTGQRETPRVSDASSSSKSSSRVTLLGASSFTSGPQRGQRRLYDTARSTTRAAAGAATETPEVSISRVINGNAPPSSEIAQVVNWAYRGKRPVGEERAWTTERHLITGVRTTEADVAEMLLRCQRVGPEQEALLLAKRPEGSATDSQLIGTINVQRLILEGYDTPRAEIGFFSVDPDMQGQGVGNRLLAAAEAMARDQIGATHASMWVISLREDIIEWYGRKGYKPTGETAPFPETDDDRFGKPAQQLQFVRLEKDLL